MSIVLKREQKLKERINEVNILGVGYDNLSRSQVILQMEGFIQDGGHHFICTPNADHVLLAKKDFEFFNIIQNADLVISDGMGVVYASKILGKTFIQNVTGRLLVLEFAQIAAIKGYKLFFLGGKNSQSAKKGIDNLIVKNPGLKVSGYYSPPFMNEFGDSENKRIFSMIEEAKPDVLFVCLGTPKQEKWIARNLDKLHVPLSIGVGATLDMLAGEILEPPRWVTNIGLEWFVKLVQEPRRLWRRYILGNPYFIYLVFKEKMRHPY